MTTGFMCYIHEGDVIRGTICSLYMDTAWYSDLSSRSIALEYDIVTQPAMRYLAFAISSDNVSWEVLHVQDMQNVNGMANVTIPETYDGTVKLGIKLYDAPPTVGSKLNVGFDYVVTGGISVSTTSQNEKTVSLTCETEGAVIRYTVDGSEPTVESTEYAGAFAIDGALTIKAKAYKDGMLSSEVVVREAVFKVETPVISVDDENVVTITCATQDAVIYYTMDGSDPSETSTAYAEPFTLTAGCTLKAKACMDGLTASDIASETMVFGAGDTIFVDGIEVLVIADLGEETEDRFIAVDKNHDLSYYVKGDDYFNSPNYNQSPGTYGYVWGGYGTETGIQSTAIGTGLTNTNSLIGMNLQPTPHEGWWVVWDKVVDFRQSHSDKWFVPSKDELNLIYENRASLSNLSNDPFVPDEPSGFSTYWSSSEDASSPSDYAWYQMMSDGSQDEVVKVNRQNRTRLCTRFDAVVLKHKTYNVGDVVTVDGIETLIIADLGEGAENGRYIGVDKNHDLSYYISGDDYVNQSLPVADAKYGYEWGGYGMTTYPKGTEVGTGLPNTDARVNMGLSPEDSDWSLLWDMVDEFWTSHSARWFVPSKNELNLVYQNKAALSNLSTVTDSYYWSSSEAIDSMTTSAISEAWRQQMDNGSQITIVKSFNYMRTRLCVQFDTADNPDNPEEDDMIKKRFECTVTSMNVIGSKWISMVDVPAGFFPVNFSKLISMVVDYEMKDSNRVRAALSVNYNDVDDAFMSVFANIADATKPITVAASSYGADGDGMFNLSCDTSDDTMAPIQGGTFYIDLYLEN